MKMMQCKRLALSLVSGAALLSIAAAVIVAGTLLAARPALAIDTSSISGTFDGCDWDKTYELMDGRTLVCRCYRYHYAYAPKVIVIDSTTVLIDGDEYGASVR